MRPVAADDRVGSPDPRWDLAGGKHSRMWQNGDPAPPSGAKGTTEDGLFQFLWLHFSLFENELHIVKQLRGNRRQQP